MFSPLSIFQKNRVPWRRTLYIELTKIITNIHPEIVVAILSRHDMPEYRSAALQNGADLFLPKSSPIQSIFDCVNSIFSRQYTAH